MNWVDIIATTFFTTIAGATVAFISIYLKERMNRKKLLKALCREIKSNEDTARLNIERWEPDSKFDELYRFHESVFKRIWSFGEISNISPEILYDIEWVYSNMNKFNNNELWDTPDLMCNDIREILLHLLETFCKEI